MSRFEAKQLSKSFGGVRALENFSCTVNDGEIVGIIGPNGAGKSTTFNVMTGVYRPDSGRLSLDGNDFSALPAHRIARLGIARTFQNIRLFRGLSVLENVMVAGDPYSSYGFSDLLRLSRRMRTEERALRERSLEVLKVLGLARYSEDRPFALPYGLQRKLELARALSAGPRLLLLDEPAAGLNPTEVQEFITLLRELRERFDFSAIVIEHRLEVIMQLCSRIYVLNFGRLLAEGTPREIWDNPEVAEAYTGKGDFEC